MYKYFTMKTYNTPYRILLRLLRCKLSINLKNKSLQNLIKKLKELNAHLLIYFTNNLSFFLQKLQAGMLSHHFSSNGLKSSQYHKKEQYVYQLKFLEILFQKLAGYSTTTLCSPMKESNRCMMVKILS